MTGFTLAGDQGVQGFTPPFSLCRGQRLQVRLQDIHRLRDNFFSARLLSRLLFCCHCILTISKISVQVVVQRSLAANDNNLAN